MNKRLFRFIICVIISAYLLPFYTPVVSYAGIAKDASLKINGKSIKKIESPIMVKGWEYYSVNEIITELGYELKEDQKGKRITLIREDKKISVSVAEKQAVVNGKAVFVGGYGLVYKNARYYIPFNVFLNALDTVVNWDIKQKCIELTVHKTFFERVLFINAIRYAKGKPIINLMDKETVQVFEKSKKIITSITRPGMSELEKEFAVYDYITHNVKYNFEGYLNNTIQIHDGSAYGAIVLNRAVCYGVAKGTDLLLKMAGIQSDIVIGKANGYGGWQAHAWNLVRIDGHYYQLDATWDLAANNGDSTQENQYAWFNLTTKEIGKSHYGAAFDGRHFSLDFKAGDAVPLCRNEKFSFMRETLGANVRDGQWFYYSNPGDDFRVYRMKLDGSSTTLLSNEPVINGGVIVSGNAIVYLGPDNKLVCITKDGTVKRILRDNVEYLQKAGDSICYVVTVTYGGVLRRSLYISNIDGTQETLVAENAVLRRFEQSYCPPYLVYCVAGTDGSNGRIEAYNLEEQRTVTLFSKPFSSWTCYEGSCYIACGTKLYKVSNDGKTSKVLSDESKFGATGFVPSSAFHISLGFLNYTILADGIEKPCRIALDSGKRYEGAL